MKGENLFIDMVFYTFNELSVPFGFAGLFVRKNASCNVLLV